MSRRFHLIWKIYPTYVLAALIPIVAVVWIAAHSFQHLYIDSLVRDLEEQTKLVGEHVLLRSDDWPHETKPLQGFIKHLGVENEVRYTIILPTGLVISDSEKEPGEMDNHAHRPEISEALKGQVGVAVRHSDTLNKNMMYVATPLYDKDQIALAIRASVPIVTVESVLRTLNRKIAVTAMLVALVVGVLGFLAAKIISRPLVVLRRSAEVFAKGDFEKKILVDGPVEIEGLSDAMNAMAEQLDDRIKTVIRERNEIEAILTGMVEGVVAFDTNRSIIRMNGSAAAFFGVPLSKARGAKLQELIDNKDLSRLVDETLAKGATTQQSVRIGKEERILEAHGTPLLSAARKIIGAVIVVNDVTKIRRLETIRRDFVSQVSSEIRTPIGDVKALVNEISSDLTEYDPEEAYKVLGVVESRVNQLNATVSDLLTLSQVERVAETGELKLRSENICDVLDKAVTLCDEKLVKRSAQVEVDCDRKLSANVDARNLAVAVSNLIDNALEATEPGSVIKVSARQAGEKVTIAVEDHGKGIEPEHRDKIFERFYRIESFESLESGGTGLGLAIVKRVVESHGGTVTVQSAPGKGSTFTIYLQQNRQEV